MKQHQASQDLLLSLVLCNSLELASFFLIFCLNISPSLSVSLCFLKTNYFLSSLNIFIFLTDFVRLSVHCLPSFFLTYFIFAFRVPPFNYFLLFLSLFLYICALYFFIFVSVKSMSPVSPVFCNEATVSIGLKNVFRVRTSILY